MECPECGHEFVPLRLWPWRRRWCSGSCRRRMVRELRDLSLTVYRCRAAIEMPDVIEARDVLVRRFVSAAVSPAMAPPRKPPDRSQFMDSDDDLPLYWS